MISLLFDISEESNEFIESLNFKELMGNEKEDKEYPENVRF